MPRSSRSSLTGAVAVGALLVTAAPSLGATVTPSVVAGNPTCADLGQSYGHPDWQGLKVDPPKSGTYTSADGAFTVTVTVAADSKSFDFTVADGELVDSVLAKGGDQGGNLYDYGSAGTNGDSALESPVTGLNGNGGVAALSHISFCYVADKTPPPPPVVTPTPKGDETPTPTPTPETQAAPAPQAPAGAPAVAAAPQIAVLGARVKSHAKKKAHKKARKHAKVKKLRVKAVRAPHFAG